MEKIYTSELRGSTWWVVTPEPQFDGQTLISDHVSEAAANRAAHNLNLAFQEGKLAGGKSGLYCPFCNEQGDFDAIGLKYHLEVYCTEFQNTKQL